jgi:hypothetical protein
MTSDDRAVALTPMVHVDPVVARKAALYVAGHSRDAEDCALLLDVLGLRGRPVRSSASVRAQNAQHGRRKSA